MRKSRKLVTVLSAAAVMCMGATMASYAAGWSKDAAGDWHYYDEDNELVTGEWKKDGEKWFYLDDDGVMMKNSWVDDERYLGEDGAMLKNTWKKLAPDEDFDEPGDGGSYWYYFDGKGKKLMSEHEKINGKTYYFNENGQMLTGWQEFDGRVYYLGNEDQGWRAENQWLWLEKSGVHDDSESGVNGVAVLGCEIDDHCDDEGWYYFRQGGDLYKDGNRKRINGKYYVFNEHGQMLYEWINNDTSVTHASGAQLDGFLDDGQTTTVDKMLYHNVVENGASGNGWFLMEGAQDTDSDMDTAWYYVKDGEVKASGKTANELATYNGDREPVYTQRLKVDKKYFAFNDKGQMLTGLQYDKRTNAFYLYDDKGYTKTGKTEAECDDDSYFFSFRNTNGGNGQGVDGVKDNYLYFNGKRLEAEDDYALYFHDGSVYLVNEKGKVQKATAEKKFYVENSGIANDAMVKTNSNGKVETVKVGDVTYTAYDLMLTMLDNVTNSDDVTLDNIVRIPYICLYDDIFTYTNVTLFEDSLQTTGEGFLYKNNASEYRYPMYVLDMTNAVG